MGRRLKASTFGEIIGPPPEYEYAVDPVLDEIIIPSAFRL